MADLSIQELEHLLAHALQRYGFPSQEAHKQAKRWVVAIKRKREKIPSSPPVIIDDYWKVSKFINIRIKASANKDPRQILENYLKKRDGYPPFERWEVACDFGGPTALFVIYKCTLSARLKKVKSRPIVGQNMSQAEINELIAKLKSIVK